MRTLGNIIKTLRNDKGLTQAELANVLNIKRPTLAKWETNRATPDISMLKKIASFFNISMDYMLFGEGTRGSVIAQAIPINDSNILEILVKKERITEEQYQSIVKTKSEILRFLPDRDIKYFLDKNQCDSFLDTYDLKKSGIGINDITEAALEGHSDIFLFVNSKLPDIFNVDDTKESSWWTVIETAESLGITPEQLNSLLEIIKQIKTSNP